MNFLHLATGSKKSSCLCHKFAPSVDLIGETTGGVRRQIRVSELCFCLRAKHLRMNQEELSRFSHVHSENRGDVMLFDHNEGDSALQTPPGDPGIRAS